MPRFDRTGPEGKGPKTGRKLGNCVSNAEKTNPLTYMRIRENRRMRNFRNQNRKS
jgi:hypothetical protein